MSKKKLTPIDPDFEAISYEELCHITASQVWSDDSGKKRRVKTEPRVDAKVRVERAINTYVNKQIMEGEPLVKRFGTKKKQSVKVQEKPKRKTKREKFEEKRANKKNAK